MAMGDVCGSKGYTLGLGSECNARRIGVIGVQAKLVVSVGVVGVRMGGCDLQNSSTVVVEGWYINYWGMLFQPQGPCRMKYAEPHRT